MDEKTSKIIKLIRETTSQKATIAVYIKEAYELVEFLRWAGKNDKHKYTIDWDDAEQLMEKAAKVNLRYIQAAVMDEDTFADEVDLGHVILKTRDLPGILVLIDEDAFESLVIEHSPIEGKVPYSLSRLWNAMQEYDAWGMFAKPVTPEMFSKWISNFGFMDGAEVKRWYEEHPEGEIEDGFRVWLIPDDTEDDNVCYWLTPYRR